MSYEEIKAGSRRKVYEIRQFCRRLDASLDLWLKYFTSFVILNFDFLKILLRTAKTAVLCRHFLMICFDFRVCLFETFLFILTSQTHE